MRLRQSPVKSYKDGIPQDENPARDHALSNLKIYAESLAERHPEVEEVRLFGSSLAPHVLPRAFDLLVVLRQTEVPIEQRHRTYTINGLRLTVHVHPLTRKEIQQEINKGNAA